MDIGCAAFNPVSVAEDSRVWDVTQPLGKVIGRIVVLPLSGSGGSKKDEDEGTVILQNIRNCSPKRQCPRQLESTSV